jgi:hypothetical protein
MEKLFQLIFQNHPDFAKEIKGVSEVRILRLERMSHLLRFPQGYRTFLHYMGEVMGRVNVIQRGESQWAPGDIREFQYNISVDYASLLREYKRDPKNVKNGFEPLLQDLGAKPNDYLLIGINSRGADNGNFFIDLLSENLKVVEICYTRGIMERSPSLVEFLFNDYFHREVSTFLHNKEWFV